MADAREKIAALIDASGLDVGFSAISVEKGTAIDVNGDALYPTASTFKVPVMVEVYAQARQGKFKISDRLAFEERFRIIGSGVIQTLDVGLNPSIRDLMTLMTIISDNTATDMLCDLVGLDTVIARMRSLGLANIHTPAACHGLFRRSFGMPLEGAIDYPTFKAALQEQSLRPDTPAFARDSSNNAAAAVDMAKLMVLIAKGEAGVAEDCADMLAIMKLQNFQDRVPRYLPAGSVANKTGSFRSLRNDVGLIRRGAGDTIAFAMFTIDPTTLPHGNSRQLQDANVRVASVMGEAGQILWDDFAR